MIVHVSAAYSIVGVMHVSTSVQIVFISSWLKSLLPALLNMVCSAASVFPFVFFWIWSSMDPLLFIVVTRFIGLGSFVPVWKVCLVVFSYCDCLAFFSAQILGGIFLIFHRLYLASSSSLFLWIRATSSIHSRHPCIWLPPIFVIPVFSSLISLAISSMRFAYWITDSTPPCLMLSLIFIGLVFPIWF